MANFSTDTDLTFYQPDILTFGIASFTTPNDYHAQARADIERDLRIKWYPVYVKQTYRDISLLNTTEMNPALLTDSQFKRLSVYKVIGSYACPQLTKYNSNDNPDRFQVMMKHYQQLYAEEFDSILKDGVEYDADDSNTVADSEKAPYHRLQLIR
ncbi:hypothetical protein EB001_16495 [bacterium]|nr:hypothetical protein [bacterium]